MIDYEFLFYNYRGFEIGAFFCEFMGFKVETENYPDKKQQMRFLNSYLIHFHGMEPTDEDLKSIYVEANIFSLLSHLFWGSIGLLQSKLSSIEFDYKTYSNKRISLLINNKERFLQNDGSQEFFYQI